MLLLLVYHFLSQSCETFWRASWPRPKNWRQGRWSPRDHVLILYLIGWVGGVFFLTNHRTYLKLARVIATCYWAECTQHWSKPHQYRQMLELNDRSTKYAPYHGIFKVSSTVNMYRKWEKRVKVVHKHWIAQKLLKNIFTWNSWSRKKEKNLTVTNIQLSNKGKNVKCMKV